MKYTGLWLLKNTTNNGWDTFDSCLVTADDADDAIQIIPGGNDEWGKHNYEWCEKPEDVQFEFIGKTNLFEPGTVIIASFNAG